MMSITLGDAYVRIRADDAKLGSDLNKSEQQVRSWSGKVSGIVQNAMGTALGFVAAQGIMRLTSALVEAGPKLISLGSDAEEMMGKFNVVFADQADRTIGKLDEMTAKMGRSKFEARQFASSFQDTFVPLGFARDKAADLSMQLTELTYDVSSFNNTLESDTARDFQSAIVGNHETVRKYGIIITQAALDQELLNMGIAGGVENATEQQKVQARLNMIVKGTSDAQGDAIRTSTSWANTMRRLKSVIKDTATDMGTKLLPVLSPLLADLSEFVQNIGPKVAEGFTKIIDVVASDAVLGRVKDFGKALIGSARGAWEWLNTIGADKVKDVWGGITDGMGSAVANVKVIWDKLPPVIPAIIEVARIETVNAIKKYSNSVLDGFERLKAAFSQRGLSGLWEQLKTEITYSLDEGKKAIGDAVPGYELAGQSLGDAITNWLRSPEGGKKMAADINVYLLNMWRWFSSKEVEQAVHDAGYNISKWLWGGIGQLLSGREGDAKGNDNAQKLLGIIKRSTNLVLGQVSSIGRNLIDTFFKGMGEGLLTTDIGTQIANKVRSFFNLPSVGVDQSRGVIGMSTGGYAGRGVKMLGERGREFVLNADTTRALESQLGSLTQQGVLGAVGVNGTLNVNFGGNVPAGVSPSDIRQVVTDEVGGLFRQHAKRSR